MMVRHVTVGCPTATWWICYLPTGCPTATWWICYWPTHSHRGQDRWSFEDLNSYLLGNVRYLLFTFRIATPISTIISSHRILWEKKNHLNSSCTKMNLHDVYVHMWSDGENYIFFRQWTEPPHELIFSPTHPFLIYDTLPLSTFFLDIDHLPSQYHQQQTNIKTPIIWESLVEFQSTHCPPIHI